MDVSGQLPLNSWCLGWTASLFGPNGNSMTVMLKRHAAGPDPVTIINTQGLRDTCGPSRSRNGVRGGHDASGTQALPRTKDSNWLSRQ